MANDLWESLVGDESEDSFETENDRLAPLMPEINMISNESIRSFVRSILLKADIFWQIPASFTGKHHPPDEHGEGGNVLHTKRVVRVVALICESQERDPFECDMMYAAAILHDLTKGVLWGDGTVAYDPLHPITAERFISLVREHDRALATDATSSVLGLEDEVIFGILRMIRCSHGPWSAIPELIPITQMEWNIHLADRIASKLHLITDEEVLLERWVRTGDVAPESDNHG